MIVKKSFFIFYGLVALIPLFSRSMEKNSMSKDQLKSFVDQLNTEIIELAKDMSANNITNLNTLDNQTESNPNYRKNIMSELKRLKDKCDRFAGIFSNEEVQLLNETFSNLYFIPKASLDQATKLYKTLDKQLSYLKENISPDLANNIYKIWQGQNTQKQAINFASSLATDRIKKGFYSNLINYYNSTLDTITKNLKSYFSVYAKESAGQINNLYNSILANINDFVNDVMDSNLSINWTDLKPYLLQYNSGPYNFITVDNASWILQPNVFYPKIKNMLNTYTNIVTQAENKVK